MSNAPFNPYQPPAPVEPKPSAVPPGSETVRYMYAYNYVFENPNWMTNMLYAAVCMLIPVIGPLILLGYQFEIVETLHRNPGRTYPDFDFNKFTYYLTRGIWPFLVQLVCSLPMVFVVMFFYVFMVISMIAAGAAGGKEYGGVFIMLAIFVDIFVMTVVSVVLGMVIQPFILRAGLSQDFAQGFKFGWAFDFLKKNWVQILMFQLFFVVTSTPMAMIGMVLCVIPLYAVIALLILAQANMHLQLYHLYLARGGEPIPLKEPPPQAAAYAAS